MKRFILTGAPGAGKTSILRALAADLVDVPAGTVAERAAAIGAHIRSWTCRAPG